MCVCDKLLRCKKISDEPTFTHIFVQYSDCNSPGSVTQNTPKDFKIILTVLSLLTMEFQSDYRVGACVSGAPLGSANAIVLNLGTRIQSTFHSMCTA